ncbi:MAG: S1 family peptidase [Porticoccaceae bacterium]
MSLKTLHVILLAIVPALFATEMAISQESSEQPPEQIRSRLSQLYDQVYQIQIIESSTQNKSALGSGFQISEDGLVITNYHVVSGLVFEPSHHKILYVDQNDNEGELELIHFDAVNDLALLRKTELSEDEQYLELARQDPELGDSVYSLGNPRNVGMLMVSGAYNGLSDYSFAGRVLFSGSLNPGMSGGPAVNASGEVIGVNVSTAGSQLSFLVPVAKIEQLLAQASDPWQPDNYITEIASQVKAFQADYFDQLLAPEWTPKDLGEQAQVTGELGLDTSCWGSSNENDQEAKFRSLSLTCNNSNHIYLNGSFNTGVLHYSYAYQESGELGPIRFHKLIDDLAFYPDNRATDDEVTEYVCEQQYLTPSEEEQGHYIQTGFCTRAYIDMNGLYDVLFYRHSANSSRSLLSHFTLAGVSMETAMKFTGRFLESASWK